MKRPRILIAVGARPNFMKAAPVLRALKATGRFQVALVHTGQHYDPGLSAFFFKDLKLPVPIHLKVGSASRIRQMEQIIRRMEPLLRRLRPDGVIVVGDVNSTVACALAARRVEYPRGTACSPDRRRPLLAHVEAGLRSFDPSMPEEINRVLTDHLSDLLFAPSPDGVKNLRKEKLPSGRIFFVGNTMIDSLLQARSRARSSTILKRLKLTPGTYALVTLHRPSNVDSAAAARPILLALQGLSGRLPVVFPIHPRTRQAWSNSPLFKQLSSKRQFRVIPPLGYLDFLKLMGSARLVLTDSGGIQEETTLLGVPCLTLRKNTERPVTLTRGTNRLAGTSTRGILSACGAVLRSPRRRKKALPPRWDGEAARRIVRVLRDKVETSPWRGP